MKPPQSVFDNYNSIVREWSLKRTANLVIFNLSLLALVVLRSAGYFAPFFPLTITVLVFIAEVLAVVLLGLRSRGLFALAATFLIFGLILRLITIEAWAERMGIYTFESLLIGVFVSFLEIGDYEK